MVVNVLVKKKRKTTKKEKRRIRNEACLARCASFAASGRVWRVPLQLTKGKEKKADGEEVVTQPEKAPEKTEVSDILKALEASLADARKRKPRHAAHA